MSKSGCVEIDCEDSFVREWKRVEVLNGEMSTMVTSIFLVLLMAYCSQGQTLLRLNSGEQNYMLTTHNNLRTRTRAQAMRKLVYSEKLATEAEKLATACAYVQADGQALYAGPAPRGTARPQLSAATNFWIGESSAYSLTRMTCAIGRTCSHYTQMVNKDTTEFGCAMALCGDIKSSTLAKGGVLVACKYNPAGPAANTAPYVASNSTNGACTQCATFGAEFWCVPGQNVCNKLDIPA